MAAPRPVYVLTASDAAWAEAVRREAVIRPLVTMTPLGSAAAARAARDLGLSMTRVYVLIRSFRAEPATSSLLSALPGPLRGKRSLHFAVEAKIEEAIEAVYLQPERPTLKRVLGELRQDQGRHHAGR